EAIKESILKGKKAIEVLKSEFNGTISDEELNPKGKLDFIDFDYYGIAKTNFQKIIVDSFYVEKFDTENSDFDSK
ncbi:hypothetical protein EON25_15270, partial [Listeria monocytogenes]|nr:hypothetical protein [Listeria monocytogenes]